MEFSKLTSGAYAVRLLRGEEIVEELARLASAEGIGGAVFGIGTVKDAELGYFDRDERQYIRKRFERDMELLSLVGNISELSGKPIVHLHAVVGDNHFDTFGGHLFSAYVSATCEIVVFPWRSDEITREKDEETGLAMWKLAG